MSCRATLEKEFPMVGAEEASEAMIEEDAGLIYADKCVKTLQVCLYIHGYIMYSLN